MVFSGILLAIGAAMSAIMASGLFFLGKNKDTKSSSQELSKDNPQQSKSDNVRIEELRNRARSGPSKRLIPKDQLERSKRELRTLLLEKELVSSALTRLYEAEASGEITREERETLGSKYREELKSLDGKIVGIDAFIEVGDLETLRDQLLKLVSEKIEAIERRIERTQVAAQPLIKQILERNNPAVPTLEPEMEKRKLGVPDISDLLATPIPHTSQVSSTSAEKPEQELPRIAEQVVTEAENRPIASAKRKVSSSDGKVEELQKELLEALDRLEKLDVET